MSLPLFRCASRIGNHHHHHQSVSGLFRTTGLLNAPLYFSGLIDIPRHHSSSSSRLYSRILLPPEQAQRIRHYSTSTMQSKCVLKKAFDRAEGASMGLWQCLPGANVSRTLARTPGIDWVMVDCEHGNLDGKRARLQLGWTLIPPPPPGKYESGRTDRQKEKRRERRRADGLRIAYHRCLDARGRAHHRGLRR